MCDKSHRPDGRASARYIAKERTPDAMVGRYVRMGDFPPVVGCSTQTGGRPTT